MRRASVQEDELRKASESSVVLVVAPPPPPPPVLPSAKSSLSPVRRQRYVRSIRGSAFSLRLGRGRAVHHVLSAASRCRGIIKSSGVAVVIVCHEPAAAGPCLAASSTAAAGGPSAVVHVNHLLLSCPFLDDRSTRHRLV